MKKINPQINEVASWPGVYSMELKPKEGDEVHQITSSLNRYGEVIISVENREELDLFAENCKSSIEKKIIIKNK